MSSMSTTSNIMGAVRQKKPFVFTSLAAIFVLLFVMAVTRYHSDEYTWLRNEELHSSVKAPETLPSSLQQSADAEDIAQQKTKQESYTETFFIDDKINYSKYTFTNLKVDEYKKGGDETAILFSSIAGPKAYGKGKVFQDFFETLTDLQYEMNHMSMGFLVGDAMEYQRIHDFLVLYFDRLKNLDKMELEQSGILKKFVRKVTLVFAPFIEEFHIDRGDRHKDSLQRLRRRNIARLRNFLLYNALDNERYSLFVDSDIVNFRRKDTLRLFIDAGKDIIVPRVQKGSDEDYDRNSWAGERAKPSADELQLLDENKWDDFKFIPHDVKENMKHIYQFYKDPENKDESEHPEYIVKLDSVGGAVLFFKSEIFKQGVNFPSSHIVGTTWDRLEGYDGVETEGICYLAKPLGYECWAMPNIVADHNKD